MLKEIIVLFILILITTILLLSTDTSKSHKRIDSEKYVKNGKRVRFSSSALYRHIDSDGNIEEKRVKVT